MPKGALLKETGQIVWFLGKAFSPQNFMLLPLARSNFETTAGVRTLQADGARAAAAAR